MSRHVNIFLITIFLFVKTYSQQTSKISFEGGAVINNPLISEERLKSNGGSTTSTDWTYKYYSSTGYFLKFSYERKLVSKNNWSLFFPIGISYMSQVNKYERHGGSWGCFGGESANELRIVTNKDANLFLGSTLQYEDNKFRYTGNLIFTNCFTVDSKSSSTPYNTNDKYNNAHPQFAYNLYISSQFCILYKIKNNMWVGPSCEIFYGNGKYLMGAAAEKFRPSQSFYEDYSPSVNITGKNIWINPGIKFQIDLK